MGFNRPEVDLGRHHGLWSLWNMLTMNAQEFVELMHVLNATKEHFRGKKGEISAADIAINTKGITETIRRLKSLDLPVSVTTAEQMCLNCTNHEPLHRGLEQLYNNVMLELRGRKFYGPLRSYEQYYERPKLFGEDVFDRFPSANNDISEAGTCLALERGTACVMHLMRVVEAGLKALATAVNVGPQNDWGRYLAEIDRALEAARKAAGKRTPDELFYAEVRLTLDSVRMAWRNPTMHIENSYSATRAEQILIAVRSLMQHLATKLREPVHYVMNANAGAYQVNP